MSDKSNEIIKYNSGANNILAINSILQAIGLENIDISSTNGVLLPIAFLVIKHASKRVISNFVADFKKWKDRKIIKEDYLNTDQYNECLQELFIIFENEPLDQKKFEVLKKIFLVASTERYSGRNDPRPLEYIRKCKSLNSGEILLLFAEYRDHLQNPHRVGGLRVEDWLNNAAKNSGLNNHQLVTEHENGLRNKLLIHDRNRLTGDPKDYITIFEKGRLTALGYELCEYIEHYDEIENELTKINK